MPRTWSKGSARGSRRSERAAPAAPAYVTRRIPFFEFMGEEGKALDSWPLEDLVIACGDQPFVLVERPVGLFEPCGVRLSLDRALGHQVVSFREQVGPHLGVVRPHAGGRAGEHGRSILARARSDGGIRSVWAYWSS